MPANPLSIAFCSASTTTTSYPAIAATCAMPEPMRPQPSTPIFFNSIFLSSCPHHSSRHHKKPNHDSVHKRIHRDRDDAEYHLVLTLESDELHRDQKSCAHDQVQRFRQYCP